jgi:hypothetical protein
MVQRVEVSGVRSFRISTHLNQKHLYFYSGNKEKESHGMFGPNAINVRRHLVAVMKWWWEYALL